MLPSRCVDGACVAMVFGRQQTFSHRFQFRFTIFVPRDWVCTYIVRLPCDHLWFVSRSLLILIYFRQTNNKDINNKKTKGMVNTILTRFILFVCFSFWIHYSFIISCFFFRILYIPFYSTQRWESMLICVSWSETNPRRFHALEKKWRQEIMICISQ